MRIPACIALAALLAAPGRGDAQWRSRPMIVPAPAGAEVLPGRFTAASVPDELLVVDPATGGAVRRSHGALLAGTPWPYALPASTPIGTGRTRANNADLLFDLAYPQGSNVILRYGSAPDLAVPRAGPAGVISFAHVMPHEGDTVVFPSPSVPAGTGWIEVWDDDTSSLGGTTLVRSWSAAGAAPLAAGAHELVGIQLSPAAVALGVDDLAMPTSGGVFLFAHRPPTADLLYATPPLDLYNGLSLVLVRVDGTAAPAPPWLPPAGDALGVAAVDVVNVDNENLPDLLFTYGSLAEVPDGQGGFVPNHLVLVQATSDPADLASGAWVDLTAHPSLGLQDPVTLRQVAVGGVPAAAVWDRGLDEIVVFWPDGGGGLRTWRGEAAGRHVRDIRLADVVGSSAPDLVVVAEDVLVYPDVGDPSPVLAWEPGSPGVAVRGQDLPLAVSASDDGVFTLEWFVGDPYGVPVASSIVPAGAGAVVEQVVPGELLCDPPPQTLAVTVRATDALGAFDELSATLPVTFAPPSLALAGALPGGRLVLPPGGTSATFEGSAQSGCAPAIAFTWGGSVLDAAASFVAEDTATTTRRIVSLPEASYPALLDVAEPDVTLAASDGPGVSATAVLPVELDASGLVEITHSADVTTLAPGEIAVLRTTIRSRLGVPLAGVHVVDRLGGLAPAGDPRVSGAGVAATLRGGAEVVLDALPAGAQVVVELPVRSTGRPGASAVEARSSGGHLLTAAARAPVDEVVAPGCGCGGPAAGWEALVALAALAGWAGRRRARAT